VITPSSRPVSFHKALKEYNIITCDICHAPSLSLKVPFPAQPLDHVLLLDFDYDSSFSYFGSDHHTQVCLDLDHDDARHDLPFFEDGRLWIDHLEAGLHEVVGRHPGHSLEYRYLQWAELFWEARDQCL